MTLEHQLRRQAEQHQLIFWHHVRARRILDLIDPAQPATLADIGSGAGSLGWILRSERPRVRYRFREPITSLAEALRREFGAENELRSFDELASADVVTLLDVLEHVADPGALLSDVVQAMQPGATLVVTVPAVHALWSEWDERLGHHRRYSKSELRESVTGLPLRVGEVSFLFPELVPAAVVRRFRSARGTDAEAAEFPTLPRMADRALRSIGLRTYAARRFTPVGTSLLLVATRLGDRAVAPAVDPSADGLQR